MTHNGKLLLLGAGLAVLAILGGILLFSLPKPAEKTWVEKFNEENANATQVDFTDTPRHKLEFKFNSLETPERYNVIVCWANRDNQKADDGTDWLYFTDKVRRYAGMMPLEFTEEDGLKIVRLTVMPSAAHTPEAAMKSARSIITVIDEHNPCR